MALFDSHTHLESERFSQDRDQVIARARSAGVTRMIICGSDLVSSQQAALIASSEQGVFAAVGIHAHNARSAVSAAHSSPDVGVLDDRAFARLATLASDPAVVAIGEVGLDYHYDLSPRDVQRRVLAQQLVLARELALPVILHNRESDSDLVRVFDAAPDGLRGVLHCFMADRSLAEWALARDLYIGIAGPITFKNVRHLPDIVRDVPFDRLLVETDSPYLAPHPHRGRRNEPAYVAHVAERLAEVLGLPVEHIVAQTFANACRLFGVE